MVITLSEEDYQALRATLETAVDDTRFLYLSTTTVHGRGAESDARWAARCRASAMRDLFQPIDYSEDE